MARAGDVSRRGVLGAGAAAWFSGCASAGGDPTIGPLPLSALELVADNLNRPEGVAVTRDGRVVVSSSRSAGTIIAADGARREVGRAHHANGIAIDGDGRLIVANYGLIDGVLGNIQRVDLESGETTDLAADINGRRFTSSNFPAIGPDGAIYCSHTQWSEPQNIGAVDPQGFVYRIAANGAAELVCDGFRMANGICFSADFQHLFVAQTAVGNVVRLTRRADGGYGDPQPYGPQLGHAPDNIRAPDIYAMGPEERGRLGHTDGVALDVAGNLWVTLPFANAIVVITPAGEVIDVIRDPASTKLQHVTSIAFGGDDMRTLYIASMRNNSLWRLRVPTPGVRLPITS
ncbi:MAG: SMP-30/gluconolactonase/LRE family protein [Hyphomonadaceae bacterium]